MFKLRKACAKFQFQAAEKIAVILFNARTKRGREWKNREGDRKGKRGRCSAKESTSVPRRASEPPKHKCSALSAFYEVEIFYLPTRWRRRNRNKQAANTHKHKHTDIPSSVALSISLFLAGTNYAKCFWLQRFLPFFGGGQTVNLSLNSASTQRVGLN